MTHQISIGDRFGRLMVIGIEEKRVKGNLIIKCECDCGRITLIYKSNLRSGKSRSCGKCHSTKYVPINGGMDIVGICTNGEKFIIDSEDFEKVKAYNWYPVSTSNKLTFINRKRESLHRYIMGAVSGVEVDHIDRNRENNRRSNLRFCSHQQNQCNHDLQKNNTSGVTGVRFYKARNKFVSRIKYYGKDIHLGYFSTLIEASQIRNMAAEILFGDFAGLSEVRTIENRISNVVLEKCYSVLASKKYVLEDN